MTEESLSVDGLRVPRFLYGTAWKENETERLVAVAIAEGFRGIDTANQRRHYFEAAVGQGIAAAIGTGSVGDDLFLQTKFTFRPGQDARLPYDPAAPVATQVRNRLLARSSIWASNESMRMSCMGRRNMPVWARPIGKPGRDGSDPQQRPRKVPRH